MRFHWQNLNEKRGGGNGWGIRAGRAWLRLTDRNRLSLEWHARPKAELECFVELGGMMSGDRDMMIHASLFGLSMYLGVETPLLRRLSRRAANREGWRSGLDFRWERTASARIDIASRSASWHSRDPWWISGIKLDFADLLFGTPKYSNEIRASREVMIPMPEGSYPATIDLETSRWKRPRWFRPLVVRRACVDIPGGIPCAGKGENSWDCGDDGIWGSTFVAETVEQAIGHVVTSVLERRRRYGQASFLINRPPVLAREEPTVA